MTANYYCSIENRSSRKYPLNRAMMPESFEDIHSDIYSGTDQKFIEYLSFSTPLSMYFEDYMVEDIELYSYNSSLKNKNDRNIFLTPTTIAHECLKYNQIDIYNIVRYGGINRNYERRAI